ncbi:LptE family protein [Desulfopila sp. IMCC35008]|uniref:LPS assembly lipoprotein LptE n=1 Tax=Desulfopila sp. IMCC35008 TaxID=2653858 RepID=UPI0013D7916C|nr:LptE family protein [Desulfopila sp. IMCC35008]
MKTYSRYLLVVPFLMFLLVSCGYYNPYVYSGPEKVIYITNWKNRTSELGLDSDIYQSLVRWFQKSGSIKISKQKEGADLVLAGEVVSISIPSLSYGAGNTTSEIKVKLTVRYILKDLTSGKVVMEVPKEQWTEGYLVGASSSETSDNQDEAIKTIIDDLSQKIYQQTLVELPKL